MIIVVKLGVVFATHDDSQQADVLAAPSYEGLQVLQVASSPLPPFSSPPDGATVLRESTQ